MLETIVSSLIVILICLPAFLAYRHYPIYAKISSRLGTYAFALALAVIGFNFGKIQVLSQIPEIMTTKTVTEQVNILTEHIVISLLVYFAFVIYLTVLDYLPKILGKERDNQ